MESSKFFETKQTILLHATTITHSASYTIFFTTTTTTTFGFTGKTPYFVLVRHPEHFLDCKRIFYSLYIHTKKEKINETGNRSTVNNR